MKITFLHHPKSWMTLEQAESFLPVLKKHASEEDIQLSESPDQEGDVLFALHYPALIDKEKFNLHKNNVVIHAADLPEGRGRSPIHWQVEAGQNKLVLSLFEMAEGADAGDVFFKSTLELDGSELLDEIRAKVIKAEINMIDEFLSNWPMQAQKQEGEGSVYPKRSSKDQELDTNKSIADNFNKMRVADNEAYPLWFTHLGQRYTIKIDKK
jgi:methionyl-tRNA formyltransferase